MRAKFVAFEATESVVICYSSHRKLIQALIQNDLHQWEDIYKHK